MTRHPDKSLLASIKEIGTGLTVAILVLSGLVIWLTVRDSQSRHGEPAPGHSVVMERGARPADPVREWWNSVF